MLVWAIIVKQTIFKQSPLWAEVLPVWWATTFEVRHFLTTAMSTRTLPFLLWLQIWGPLCVRGVLPASWLWTATANLADLVRQGTYSLGGFRVLHEYFDDPSQAKISLATHHSMKSPPDGTVHNIMNHSGRAFCDAPHTTRQPTAWRQSIVNRGTSDFSLKSTTCLLYVGPPLEF